MNEEKEKKDEEEVRAEEEENNNDPHQTRILQGMQLSRVKISKNSKTKICSFLKPKRLFHSSQI